jgi:integrase
LPSNPVRFAEPLREEDPPVRDPLEPHEVLAVADVLRQGAHRAQPRHAVGPRRKGRTTVAHAPTSDELVEMRRRDEQDAAAVLLLAFCGVRAGELAALRWKHVEFTSGRLRVERSFTATGGVETSTKGKENRTTVLPDQVAGPLARMSQRPRFTGDDDLVFCNTVGGYMDMSAFRRRFKRACKLAGIKRDTRVHDLRHGFTTESRQIFSADHVRAMAGHKDARTAQRYAHPRDQTDAANRMTRYLEERIAASTSLAR